MYNHEAGDHVFSGTLLNSEQEKMNKMCAHASSIVLRKINKIRWCTAPIKMP